MKVTFSLVHPVFSQCQSLNRAVRFGKQVPQEDNVQTSKLDAESSLKLAKDLGIGYGFA
jgi:hypothetical protein